MNLSYTSLKVGDVILRNGYTFRIARIYSEGDKQWFDMERQNLDNGWESCNMDIDEVAMQNNLDKGRVYRQIGR